MKSLAVLTLLLNFSIPGVFAAEGTLNHEHAKCSCSQECKGNCIRGKSADCECKECGCKEVKSCH